MKKNNAKKHGIEVLSLSVQPDHVHLLFQHHRAYPQLK
nr:transposase [Pseudothermotoga hypogea]